MFTKTKFAAAIAALALGTTAFASASAAAPYYLWGWGWGVPVAYSSYVVPARHGHRVCRAFAEYTDWGFYVGNSIHCSRH